LPYLLTSPRLELYAFDGRSRIVVGWLLVSAGILLIVFHLTVVLYEEPTLRRTFGAGYEQYCARVPRWIPAVGLPPAP